MFHARDVDDDAMVMAVRAIDGLGQGLGKGLMQVPGQRPGTEVRAGPGPEAWDRAWGKASAKPGDWHS